MQHRPVKFPSVLGHKNLDSVHIYCSQERKQSSTWWKHLICIFYVHFFLSKGMKILIWKPWIFLCFFFFIFEGVKYSATMETVPAAWGREQNTKKCAAVACYRQGEPERQLKVKEFGDSGWILSSSTSFEFLIHRQVLCYDKLYYYFFKYNIKKHYFDNHAKAEYSEGKFQQKAKP